MTATRNGFSPHETAAPEIHRQACHYARWIVGNESDAEEIVQEAWCKLAEHESRSIVNSPDHNPTAFLFTIVRNQSIDLLRKRKRRRSVSLSEISEPQGRESDSSRAAELNDLENGIHEAFGNLPDSWAEAMRLKVAGQLTYDEIASVLGCTHAQVRTWIFRARRQLAAELVTRGWLAHNSGRLS